MGVYSFLLLLIIMEIHFIKKEWKNPVFGCIRVLEPGSEVKLEGTYVSPL